MKRITTVSLVLLIGLLTGCTVNKELKDVEARLEGLQAHFAPDRRTDRFEIEAVKRKGRIQVNGYTTSIAALDSLESYLSTLDVPVSNHVITYPDSTIGQEHFGLVHLSVCNIRSEPKHSAELALRR